MVSKIKKKVGLWTLTLLLSGMFLMAGGTKLLGMDPHPMHFFARGFPLFFMYVVGFVEVTAALVLLIPRFAALGSLALGGTMVGAMLLHLIHGDYTSLVMPAVLFGLLYVVGYARRDLVLDRFGVRELRTDSPR